MPQVLFSLVFGLSGNLLELILFEILGILSIRHVSAYCVSGTFQLIIDILVNWATAF